MQIHLILLLIFAIAVAVFALQNTVPVVVKFLFWEANLSLVLVILAAVAAGAVILFLANIASQMKYKRELKELHRQVTLLTGGREASAAVSGEAPRLSAEGPKEAIAMKEAENAENPENPENPEEEKDPGQGFSPAGRTGMDGNTDGTAK